MATKEIVSMSELTVFFEENQTEDPDMCYKVAARAIQINTSYSGDDQNVIDNIYRTPEKLPTDKKWLAFLQGIAEILINTYNLVPSYEVEWLKPAIKADIPWVPSSISQKYADYFADGTPSALKLKNVMTGNGILKAL